MKRIVSVSLGASERNHRVTAEILGETVEIERIGTDGDLSKAISLLQQLDGKVDAFGIGGIDIYIHAGNRRYMLRDGRKMASAVKITPIVDGTGLKNTLERKVIKYLASSGQVSFEGRNVLLVCAVDRFGMAEELTACKANLTLGDLIFSVGIDYPIYSLAKLDKIARVLAPVVSTLPTKYIYPTGKQESRPNPEFFKYYEEADIIAGDFLYIKRHMPERLDGKIIITNTVTKKDVDILQQAGTAKLITTTPELNGRSFGTNVMEALLVAFLQKPVDSISPEDYSNMLDKIGFLPRIVDFSRKWSTTRLKVQEG
ncbi:MAG: quinate 5-dehydrogenase [Bacillota bacterium]